jgi:hypothetical protein
MKLILKNWPWLILLSFVMCVLGAMFKITNIVADTIAQGFVMLSFITLFIGVIGFFSTRKLYTK